MIRLENTGKFVIWSVEHQAYWRPHRQGYTQFIVEAGRYNQDELIECNLDTNPNSPNYDEVRPLEFECAKLLMYNNLKNEFKWLLDEYKKLSLVDTNITSHDAVMIIEEAERINRDL